MSACLVDPSFRQALVRYARRRVPAADVDDVVQETLCDALAPGGPASRAEMLRFSMTILRRRIVDLYRARGRSPLLPGCTTYEGMHDPRATLEARDCLQRIELEPDALALLLADDPADSAAVAARVGLTPEAARQRVSRQRRRLRMWLAAAATFSLLAMLGGAALQEPRIEAEPLSAPLSGLALHATFRVESIDTEAVLPRGLVGAEVRVDGGTVLLRGRPLFSLESLEAGVGIGHTARGEPLRLFVRSEGTRLTVESWTGALRGRVVLVR